MAEAMWRGDELRLDGVTFPEDEPAHTFDSTARRSDHDNPYTLLADTQILEAHRAALDL